jgi:hypothetical protein
MQYYKNNTDIDPQHRKQIEPLSHVAEKEEENQNYSRTHK